mgnify:FL=1
MKKHVNPAKHLHEVYTMQGGVKEYNKNQRAWGALLFAGSVFLLHAVGGKIERREIKALKKRDDLC